MTPGIVIRDAQPADSGAIESLLRDAALPLEGIGEVQFTVAEHDGRVIGSAGLEIHGDAGLLRSVAVEPGWRGHGVGEALVRAVLDAAAVCKLDPVVLLTTTAPEWFPRFGFERIERRAVPQPLMESVEFTRACPATATVMRRSLAAGEAARAGAQH
jgi:amino-acid N-acetyltransferase